MFRRDKDGIAIICDNCGNKIVKNITGLELLKMNAKLPDGWRLIGNKIYCSDEKCQKKIVSMKKAKENSRKISQDNWTGTR